ncbi:ATP-hydrolysing 5-oxoprolinase, partial [Cupriavidus basilensis OR16]
SALVVPFGTLPAMQAAFDAAYRQRYAFLMQGKPLIVEALSVEAIGSSEPPEEKLPEPLPRAGGPVPAEQVRMFSGGTWHDTGLFPRDTLRPGDVLPGPAIIAERNATTVVEPGWQAELTGRDHLVLTRAVPRPLRRAMGTDADPVMLEVF